MKKSTSAILIFCLLCASGCVMHKSGPGSFDGLSETYAADAQAFAAQTAEELSRRHAPAHTSVALDRAPGVFGDVLEQKLRADGFALGSSGLGVSYRLDTLETDGTPMRGYVQVACSDGQIFSFTREVFKGTEPPFSTPVPEEHPLESRPLPERTPMPGDAQAAAQMGASAQAPASASARGVKVYPVRRTATAAAVAKRSGVPVMEFCRWNQVGPNATLTKGSPVYLSEPPSGIIPVAAAVPVPADTPEESPVPQAATPMPAPVSLPSRAQTSAALTLEKPKPSEPVAYAPVAVSMPATPSPETVTPVTEPPVAPAPSAVPTASSETLTPIATTAIEAVPVWEIHKGEMLRGLMEGWAAIAGYSLIWNAQNDYEMRSSATFSGVFVDAVKNFFAALQANGLALRVTIYQGNKVMEVSEH